MSTGISISSINRIKELAEEKKYAEALEILDTQDLDKSINPQFLRISGEIFRENKRYYDSRKVLLKSHQMSPQGTRILFELIQAYLELGYFTKARKYYEQYIFYSTPEDTQKDYVEYVMKKAEGADVKELASILIPILERIPEDKWNFEAVLLYDKLGRKDKALEESRYILENFKDSIYVKPVIEYIDDELDVDKYFCIYPKEEQEEDEELFRDLIEEENKILEADYLRMYPPEPRIMVEAEDKEAIDVKPIKEKKAKKKKNNKTKEAAHTDDNGTDTTPQILSESSDEVTQTDGKTDSLAVSEEERIKQERQAALEQLLSKKIDKDKIAESAKQIAKAIKDADTSKTKQQVKMVAESVRDNVKKATDVLSGAVGVKAILNDMEQDTSGNSNTPEGEQIVDGIIESVLEPKKVVGQVVTDEELDALIPGSSDEARPAVDIEVENKEAVDSHIEDTKEGKKETEQSGQKTQQSFEELKIKFVEGMSDQEEDKPLESLGFITVVQADVDKTMEEELPDVAGMLHQMIDNKEFYSGEDSMSFESEASYENHGFEIENCDFDMYLEETNALLQDKVESIAEENVQETASVEIIYAQESIINFDEIIPEEVIDAGDQKDDDKLEETIQETENEYFENIEETFVYDRENLRIKILLSDSMMKKLLDLKESR